MSIVNRPYSVDGTLLPQIGEDGYRKDETPTPNTVASDRVGPPFTRACFPKAPLEEKAEEEIAE